MEEVMPIREVLAFLSDLKEHNDREWFAANKTRYLAAREAFELRVRELISEISGFDEDIKTVDAKDCLFRIYRDTRFSSDKTPYKTHFGAYIASGGGRKSPRAGYYLHLEPGASFLAAGLWCPEAHILKALRRSVYENIDEFNEIRLSKEFAELFPVFFDEDKLKKLPPGFPKDFPEAEFLKLKHYIVEFPIEDKWMTEELLAARVASVLKTAYPLNRFLNYTVDLLIT